MLAGGGGASRSALVVLSVRVDPGPVVDALAADGFTVETAGRGADLPARAHTLMPSLIVLDLDATDGDAPAACRAIRQRWEGYLILLTPGGNGADRVMALDAGADDCVPSSTSPREIAARARAMLRRPRLAAGGAGPLWAGHVTLDPVSRTVQVDGEHIRLTRIEFEILHLLLERPHRVVERRRLVERV